MKKIIVIAAILCGGCAWQPRTIRYPSGREIVLVDQWYLDRVCSHVSDSGKVAVEHALACTVLGSNIHYVRHDCEGAEALTHELGLEEGIAEPTKAGMDW